MSNVTCSIPEFTCVSPAKVYKAQIVTLYYIILYISFQFQIPDFLFVEQLVKLLELREANHIEFCRIKNVVDEVLHMHKNSELNEILKLLMDPTWVATGLKIDFETLVSACISLFLLLVDKRKRALIHHVMVHFKLFYHPQNFSMVIKWVSNC